METNVTVKNETDLYIQTGNPPTSDIARRQKQVAKVYINTISFLKNVLIYRIETVSAGMVTKLFKVVPPGNRGNILLLILSCTV